VYLAQDRTYWRGFFINSVEASFLADILLVRELIS
jgi:hypothetical protein